MNVAFSNEQVTDTKWIFIGASLTVFCIAVAVAIMIIHLARKRSKGRNNYILQQIQICF